VSVRPYDESEIGIGAADQAPRFAFDSKRLEDGLWTRLGLFLLELLGTISLAALFGIAFGLLMLRLHTP
jgi:hypothetical protein